jgi:ABC-type nitrate/sulfonate/bicarbonate transport system permease component
MGLSSLSGRLIQIAFVVAIAGIWYMLNQSGSISPLLLPSMDRVGTAFMRLVQTQTFWFNVQLTLWTIAQAYAISVVAGIVVGYLVTRTQTALDVAEPMISGVFSIPLTLFFPLFVLFFGIDTASKIAYAATYSFFPIALNAIAGFSAVEEHYRRAARSMGASSYRTLRHVLLPAAFPIILNGMRVSFFICVSAVLSGETLASVHGIGRSITVAAELMETARMFAWILFVIVTTVMLNGLVTFFENRKRPA